MNPAAESRTAPAASALRRALDDGAFQTLFLLVASLLTFLGRPGSFVLQNYDGAWYAQKAKEMLASGSPWLVLYHGEPDFLNPPLPLWTMALAYELFGVSAWAAVLPSALFGAGTVLLAYRMALHLFGDRWQAFVAGAVLLLPGYFLDYARRPMVDVTLTFFVTAALFAFLRALERGRGYGLFGLCTGLAVLTKSVLGLFPLPIAFGTLLWTGRAAELRRPALWGAVALALVVGGSWHAVNWLRFGDAFASAHFGFLIWERGFEGGPGGGGGPWFFLGYLRLLAANYWPWLPVALLGSVGLIRRALRERDPGSRFLLLWIVAVLAVMSAGRVQLLRYVLPAFPALALLVAHTLGLWLSPRRQAQLLPYLAGSLALVALFVAVTPIRIPQSVSLSGRGADVVALAGVVRINTAPDEVIGNFRLATWNPRNALLFYADRYLDDPLGDPDELMRRVAADPRGHWLTRVAEFDRLRDQYPGVLHLIESSGRYAFFTARSNRGNVRHDHR